MAPIDMISSPSPFHRRTLSGRAATFLRAVMLLSGWSLLVFGVRALLFTIPALIFAGPTNAERPITSFVLADGMPHIAFVDEHQHIDQLFYQDNKWVFNDLTDAGRSPLALVKSGLTSFVLRDGMPRIAFIDGRQHVDQLLYQDHKWIFNDLTASGKAPTAAAGSSLTTFVLADGRPHIVFIDGHEHLDQLYYQDQKWIFNDLTAAGRAPSVKSGVTAFMLRDGMPHIMFVDGRQHIDELLYQDHKWVCNDLTLGGNTPLALAGSGLANFVLRDGFPHLVFIDAHSHIGELFYQNNKWLSNDLTVNGKAPAASRGTGLTTFILADGMPHIAYTDMHMHLDQLFYQDNKWVFNDLTAGASGAQEDLPQTGLTSFVLHDGRPHVAFIGLHQHVSQLYYQDNKWLFNDLIASCQNIGPKSKSTSSSSPAKEIFELVSDLHFLPAFR